MSGVGGVGGSGDGMGKRGGRASHLERGWGMGGVGGVEVEDDEDMDEKLFGSIVTQGCCDKRCGHLWALVREREWWEVEGGGNGQTEIRRNGERRTENGNSRRMLTPLDSFGAKFATILTSCERLIIEDFDIHISTASGHCSAHLVYG